jgi:hypothetical protein
MDNRYTSISGDQGASAARSDDDLYVILRWVG